MKVGALAIVQDGRYGMSVLHMHAIYQTAQSNNVVIGIRPVSKFAKALIEQGCPTKPFAVKNKSANIGPAAGLIVMNPRYCQIPRQDYSNYQQMLETAFHKDTDLTPTPCVLSRTRINELTHIFAGSLNVSIQPNQTDLLISWEKEGEIIRVIAKKKNDDNDNYILCDLDNAPILVLGKSVSDMQGVKRVMPITADYDLLVICPKYIEFNPGGIDRTPFPTQGSTTRIHALIKASSMPDYQGPKEDGKGGNWSQRTQQIVKCINSLVSQIDINRIGMNLETVHHNIEFHNPFADELERNLPSLMILPEPLDLSLMSGMTNQPVNDLTHSQVVLIETADELRQIRDILHQNGYYWPEHARYPKLKTNSSLSAIVAADNFVSAAQSKSKSASELYIKQTSEETVQQRSQSTNSLSSGGTQELRLPSRNIP